jgi:hypothetical protein
MLQHWRLGHRPAWESLKVELVIGSYLSTWIWLSRIFGALRCIVLICPFLLVLVERYLQDLDARVDSTRLVSRQTSLFRHLYTFWNELQCSSSPHARSAQPVSVTVYSEVQVHPNCWRVTATSTITAGTHHDPAHTWLAVVGPVTDPKCATLFTISRTSVTTTLESMLTQTVFFKVECHSAVGISASTAHLEKLCDIITAKSVDFLDRVVVLDSFSTCHASSRLGKP